jgi:hypothetical protein
VKPVKPRSSTFHVQETKIYESLATGDAPARETAGGRALSGPPCSKGRGLKPDIADQIGLHLRSIYDDVLAQPVPGRFLELLRELESTSSSRLSKDRM